MNRWAAAGLLAIWAVLPTEVVGQRVPPATPRVSTASDTDLGVLASWSLGLRVEAWPGVDGEALERLDSGFGAGVFGEFRFENGYGAELRVSRTSLGDGLGGGTEVPDDARLLELALVLTRSWEWAGIGISAGPGVGVERLSRDAYRRPNTGGAVLGVITVRKPLRERMELFGALEGRAALYGTPDLGFGAPPDPDGRARGTRLGFSFGVSWRFDASSENDPDA